MLSRHIRLDRALNTVVQLQLYRKKEVQNSLHYAIPNLAILVEAREGGSWPMIITYILEKTTLRLSSEIKC